MIQPLLNDKPMFRGLGAAAAKKRVERRSCRRFDLHWEALIEWKNDSGAGLWRQSEVLNVSSTGAYLQASVDLKRGAKLNLHMRVPLGDENWMSYPVQVVRVENLDGRTAIAVRFESSRPSFAAR